MIIIIVSSFVIVNTVFLIYYFRELHKFNKNIKRSEFNLCNFLNDCIYNHNPLISDTCSICLQDYCENFTVVRLPCGHVFHFKCAYVWFRKKMECPICRKKIK